MRSFVAISLIALSGFSLCLAQHDLGRVLSLSQKFYVAQRCGDLPDGNRVDWRRDSFLDDGQDRGIDLVGGYFDAGDYVKFGFPMAFTTTMLAWSMLKHDSAYRQIGEWEYAKENLKWATDYFLKAHLSDTQLIAQCGDGEQDHSFWGRPEDFPYHPRQTLMLDPSKPGSDLAGETAAALAAASMVFRNEDSAYADRLLNSAKSLFNFANNYRGRYTDSLPEIGNFYGSSSYEDELIWAGVWVYKASGDPGYLVDAQYKWDEFGFDGKYSGLGWDDKSAGMAILLYEETQTWKYAQKVVDLCEWYMNGAPTTPAGMIFLSEWGSARIAGYIAFTLLMADDAGLGDGRYPGRAAQQVGYILGNNPLGVSYVIGYGGYYPQRPHHRASSCPTREQCGGCECDGSFASSPNPNPNLLEGALVGGPDINDQWQDDRQDYVKNEVATDYNAGIQGAVAGLLAKGVQVPKTN